MKLQVLFSQKVKKQDLNIKTLTELNFHENLGWFSLVTFF